MDGRRGSNGRHAAEDEARLRVIVVDDDALARRAIRDVLHEAGFTVVAEAGNGREAVELALHYKPELVVMDVAMSSMDGIEATRRISSGSPGTRVVLLTVSDDDELGLLGLRAGACGYVTKDVDMASLPRGLRSAAVGEAVISRRLTMRLIERLRTARHDGAGMRPVRSPLTAREWEVLDLLCEGAGVEEIADALVVSLETVRTHIKNVLRKLGVRSRAEAIEVAQRMRAGVIDDAA